MTVREDWEPRIRVIEAPISESDEHFEEIDAIADRFERAWKSESSVPEIRRFLEEAPPTIKRELLKELIGIDLEYRAKRGEPWRAEDYAKRFPEIADDSLFLRGLAQPSESQVEDTPRATYADLPKQIGKYLVIENLERGGQAEVFLALHPLLKTQVVIKRFRAGKSGGSLVAVIKEGQALTALDHPNIAKVYDCDTDGGYPFLVIEYIRGQNLAQFAAGGALQPIKAAEIVIQLCKALSAAHGLGILHRDIKPHNILIDSTGRVKLIDFGLARVDEAWKSLGEEAGIISGTLPYMSPEQARGMGLVDARSDVFAVGAVLYFLLTGQPPYRRPDRMNLLEAVRAADFDRQLLENSAAPAAMKRICLKAMSFDPIARYQDVHALEAELMRLVPAPVPAAGGSSEVQSGGGERTAGGRVAAAGERKSGFSFRQKLALLGILVTCAVLLLEFLGATGPLERRLYDYRARLCQFHRPPTTQYVHLDIDDGSIDTIGQWQQWPRRLIGDVVRELSQAGAKTIAFDLLYSERQAFDEKTTQRLKQGEQTEDDKAFIAALKEATTQPGSAKLIVPVALNWQPKVVDPVLQALRRLLYENITEPSPLSAEFKARLMHDSGASSQEVDAAIKQSIVRMRQEAMLDRILPSTMEKEAVQQSLLKQQSDQRNLYHLFDEEFEKAQAMRALWNRLDVPKEWLPETTTNGLLRADGETPPIAQVAQHASTYGFVSFLPDEDGVVRSVPLLGLWRDRVVPQLGLALACADLDVDLSERNKLKLTSDAIELTNRDGKQFSIPVFTRRGERFGTSIGSSFLIPLYGPRDWSAATEENGKEPMALHRPLAWVWQIQEWRDELAGNIRELQAAYDDLKDYATHAGPFDATSPNQIDDLLKDSGLRSWLENIRTKLERNQIPAEQVAANKRWLQSVEHLKETARRNALYRQEIDERMEELRKDVAGKLVLIGMTATGADADSHPTPLHARCPGVVINGAIYSALVSGAMWTPAPAGVTYGLILLAGLVMTRAMVQTMPRDGALRQRGWRRLLHPLAAQVSPWRVTALVWALAIAWVLLNGLYLFDRKRLIMPISPPVIALLMVWALGMAAIAAERFRVVQTLRGYVDQRLVNFLARHPENELFAPKRQELTVCFTDLEGFTALSQTLGEEMVPLLQSYLSRMVPVIRGRAGVVDKFLGDGIMFFFGAPDADPQHVVNAVRCNLEMHEELERFNDEIAERRLPRLKMRSGINCGEAFVGDAGPEQAREYTAVGDTVNVAARLESANKYCGTSMLVSDSVRNSAGTEQFFFRPVGKVKLRNRTGGVMVHELVGWAKEATLEQRTEAARMQTLIGLYQEARFDGCLEMLDALDKKYGASTLREQYRKRCRELQSQQRGSGKSDEAPSGFTGEIFELD